MKIAVLSGITQYGSSLTTWVQPSRFRSTTNGFAPAFLVNVLSRASRPEGDEALRAAYFDENAAFPAATPDGQAGPSTVTRLHDFLAELGQT